MAALAFLFSFRGVAGNRAALAVWAGAALVQVGFALIGQYAPIQQRFVYPIWALSVAVVLAVSARRLHHAGYTGRWAILTLAPVAGLLAALVIALLPQQRTRILASPVWRAAGHLAMVLLVGLGLWRVWWTPLWVTGASMKPAVWVGDYVILRASPAGDAQRGEVVALRHPVTGDALVKRVIAVAGDKIAMQNGVVWLNGAPLAQLPRGQFDEIMAPQGPDALRPRCENGLVGDGAICRKSRWREVLPDGRGYDIVNITSQGPMDAWPPRIVPKGHVFLLGDNRDNSLDSRQDIGAGGLGPVSVSQIHGTARRVLFSAPASSMLAFWQWRADRFFAKVE